VFTMTKTTLRTRVLLGTVAAAALGAGTFGAVTANAAGPAPAAAVTVADDAKSRNTTQSTHLTADAAVRAAQAALDAARDANQKVTVAVVDRNGNTVVTLRGDGAGPQSYDSAVRKAYTAVSWNAPTSVLAGRLAQAPNLKDIPNTLFLAGGAPVTAKGAPIAGIGVAGAPSGDLDEKFAQAGAPPPPRPAGTTGMPAGAPARRPAALPPRRVAALPPRDRLASFREACASLRPGYRARTASASFAFCSAISGISVRCGKAPSSRRSGPGPGWYTASYARVAGMDWQSESPELWSFLGSLHCGEILPGTVAAIERFGVFVALDDGPAHPTLPGVGFIVLPELSWRRFDDPTDVVQVGQRVSCEFIGFDTYNAEARLSLKALEPDPLQAFADRTVVGQEFLGTVEKVLPFGIFVDLSDGISGLVPFREFDGRSAVSPAEDFAVGEEIAVTVGEIDVPTRRVLLFRRAVA
jgi:small subunit ribosomal protein S1